LGIGVESGTIFLLMKLFMSSFSVIAMRKIRQRNSKKNFRETMMNDLAKLYRIVLTENEDKEIVEWEYADSEIEALELALGRHGMGVAVKQAKVSNKAELLEAAFDIEGCETGRFNHA
jgi:hypothetical protein